MDNLRKKLTERLKKDKKLLFIVLLGFSGMLLLLFSGDSTKESLPENPEGCDFWCFITNYSAWSTEYMCLMSSRTLLE